jgi:hypothetical protein
MAEAPPLPAARRGFLLDTARAAGAGPLALALFAGEAVARPRGEAFDVEILAAALALEHHAIAIYDAGLARNLFPAGLRARAVEFRGDHEGHRDTQILLMRERGVAAPPALRSYGLGGWRGSGDLLREATRIELAAQDAYLALLSQVRTSDYLLTAAFILVDEARHLTVWQRALGQRLY